MIFGFLIFPGLEELDLVGPWEIINAWRRFAEGPEKCIMIAEKPEPLTCSNGMVIVPHVVFQDCPQLDFLLIPGGEGTRKEVDNPALIKFVSDQAKGCKAALSVCTGAFILHRAGLLKNRRATTHQCSLQRLRALGDVQVVEDRVVKDENIWTSAGISAGIDMALAFIAHTAGEKAAGRVQFITEYYPATQSYGGVHELPQAPLYVKNWPEVSR